RTAALLPPPAGLADFRQHPDAVCKEKLFRETLALKPDLLFVFGIEAAVYAPFDTKIPALGDFSRCEYIAVQKENSGGGMFKKLTGAFEWSKTAAIETGLASRFSTLFLPRERDVYYLSKQSALNLTVLPDAIDTEAFDISGWAPEEDRLLFTGSVTEEGNLNAVRYYRDHFADEFYKRGVTLYVTGKYLESQKNSLFNDKVVPMGFVRDIREAFRTSQAVVIPIMGGIGAVGKITEAMAAGVPVIATKDGAEGLRVTPADECILIANTPADMVAAWEKLLDRDYADRLRQNARQIVEDNYSWKANGKLLKDAVSAAK
ncbi:MAG: glycosyltransferase, partial [Abditibacteriota bacterium]|nr:glycosyltransferase [Abditibacteriota bacterium]